MLNEVFYNSIELKRVIQILDVVLTISKNWISNFLYRLWAISIKVRYLSTIFDTKQNGLVQDYRLLHQDF